MERHIQYLSGNAYEKNYERIPFENDSAANFELLEHISVEKSWFGGLNQQNRNFDYFSNRMSQNRPDLQDSILDRLDKIITSKDISRTPILEKIYNLDATKKSTIELINNMNTEINEIIVNNEIDEYNKRSIIKECKGMYYEIIYRALKEENIDTEKLEMIKMTYGKNNDLIKDISNYFENKRKSELVYINGLKKIDRISEKAYQEYCNSLNRNIDEKIEFIEELRGKYNNYDGAAQEKTTDEIEKIIIDIPGVQIINARTKVKREVNEHELEENRRKGVSLDGG